MSTDSIDLTMVGECLAKVRRTYGEDIDLANLGRLAFATLLGVSAIAYDAYEHGERPPSADFLVALRNKTGVCLDHLLTPAELAMD